MLTNDFTSSARVRVAALALLLMLPWHDAGAQTARASCGFGSGFMKLHGHDVVFSTANDSAGPTLGAAVVVRASSRFESLPSPESQPAQWRVNGVQRGIGGATFGPMWIGHEQSTNTVWLGSVAIPLDTNNVVLVEVDAHDTPHVVGRARIDTSMLIVPMTCDASADERRHRVFEDVLWARFQEKPVVRAFLSH